MTNINPNLDGDFGPVQGPGQVGPLPEVGEEQDVLDPLSLSTLSPSQQEALMVLYAMNMPILIQPGIQGENGIETITAMVGAKMSEIGSQMWDSYLDHLAKEKERINDELNSIQYKHYLEYHSPAGRQKEEDTTPVNVKSAIRSNADYQEWLQSQPAGSPELAASHAAAQWNSLIDVVSNYVDEARKDNAGAASFMAASFVISASFIGNYMNVVDVASTDMVAAKPIQDAVGPINELIPDKLQQDYQLAINLFVVGLANISNAEAIGKAMNDGQLPVTKDTVLAFARNTLAKVSTNEVNAYLLTLLTNTIDKSEISTQLPKLVVMAKAIMISVALAALYQFETSWISPQDFIALVNGKLNSRSDEESALVKALQDLKGQMKPSEWETLLNALATMIGTKPSLRNLVAPTKVYNGVAANLSRGDQAA